MAELVMYRIAIPDHAGLKFIDYIVCSRSLMDKATGFYLVNKGSIPFGNIMDACPSGLRELSTKQLFVSSNLTASFSIGMVQW